MWFVRESTKNRWKNQMNRTSSEIKTSKDFSFIDRYIKDKRFILLGENSHGIADYRSEEHTSELQSRENLVCRLLLEKKKQINRLTNTSTLVAWSVTFHVCI